jgi:hypothetical protein
MDSMDSAVSDTSPRRLARIAGGLYLINILGGAFAIGVVPAVVVDAFCTSGTFATLVDHVRARLGGIIDVVALPLPAGFSQHTTAYADVIAGLQTVPSAHERHGTS